MKRITLLFAIVLSLLSPLSFSADADQWQEIQQPYFSVIYQAGLEDEASRVADLLNYYLEQHLEELPLNGAFKPIPVVLYTQAHVSNGNVGIAPARSHWYNKPSAFAGLEWFDVLAVHEGRHMLHFNQLFDHKTGKILHLLFGQQGLQILGGLFIPTWYIEGDAVLSETELTLGGRGRSAAFSLWLRADWLSNTPYNYERSMLGTGFDRLPYLSPYDYGYFFSSYFKTNYDDQLMDRVTEKTGTWMALNFNDAVVSETKSNLRTHHQKMTDEFSQQWQAQLDSLTLTDIKVLQANPFEHWRSLYPVGVKGDDLVAVEVDVKQGHRVVSLSDAAVRELTPIARDVSSAYWTGAKNKSVFLAADDLCWVASKPHLKLANQPYTVLECWQGNSRKTIVDRSLLTSAGYGHGLFIGHEFDEQRQSFVLLFDRAGNEVKRLELPKRSLAYDFAETENGWAYVLQEGATQSIVEVDSQLASQQVLAAFESENVRSPLVIDDWLLFVSDLTGIDQVMAKNLNTKQEFQILTRPFGSYFLTRGFGDADIILSDYTSTGQQLVSFQFNPEFQEHWLPRAQIEQAVPTFQFKEVIPESKLGSSYKVSPYNPGDNLWNPHSWNVFYDGSRLSGSVESTNVMQTLDLDIGLGIVPEEQDWVGYAAAQTTLEDGGLVSAAAEKGVTLDGQSFWASQLSIAWPMAVQDGVYSEQWFPSAGLQWVRGDNSSPIILFGAQLGYSRFEQAAFHDIQVPFGVQSQLAANYNLSTDGVAAYSDLYWFQRGLNAQQSLSVNGSAQWLVGEAVPIMAETTLFPGAKNSEVSARGVASYEWNLGPVGRSFTPMLYWRNTALVLTGALEYQSDQSSIDSAVGATLKPSLNLFRNANLRVAPNVSAFYRPSSEQWTVYFELLVGGY